MRGGGTPPKSKYDVTLSDGSHQTIEAHHAHVGAVGEILFIEHTAVSGDLMVCLLAPGSWRRVDPVRAPVCVIEGSA